MLRHVMDPLLASADIRHVSLLQGTKAYGIHHPSVGWTGVRNPLRERHPRVEHPNFYFLQEDYLRAKQDRECVGSDGVPADGGLRRRDRHQHEPDPGHRCMGSPTA